MARVKGGYASKQRHKRVLKQAKGYFGSKHLLYKTAHEQVMHSYKYAYISRRLRKRDYRKLWIARINAAARMNGLKKANVQVNRKMLSEIAIADPESFKKICDTAKANLK